MKKKKTWERGFPAESTKRRANTEHNKQNPKKGKGNYGCEGQAEDLSPFSSVGFLTSQWRVFILEGHPSLRYQRSQDWCLASSFLTCPNSDRRGSGHFHVRPLMKYLVPLLLWSHFNWLYKILYLFLRRRRPSATAVWCLRANNMRAWTMFPTCSGSRSGH